MWHVLAFFRGGVHGEMSHDALAKEIALAGRDWATKHFVSRRILIALTFVRDMRTSKPTRCVAAAIAELTAQFRLLLEYGRLWSLDRAQMDYTGTGVGPEPIWDELGDIGEQ